MWFDSVSENLSTFKRELSSFNSPKKFRWCFRCASIVNTRHIDARVRSGMPNRWPCSSVCRLITKVICINRRHCGGTSFSSLVGRCAINTVWIWSLPPLRHFTKWLEIIFPPSSTSTAPWLGWIFFVAASFTAVGRLALFSFSIILNLHLLGSEIVQ